MAREEDPDDWQFALVGASYVNVLLFQKIKLCKPVAFKKEETVYRRGADGSLSPPITLAAEASVPFSVFGHA